MEAWKAKIRVVKTLESQLSKEEALEARKDHHAKRRPRACGLTLHTGVGCPLACAYCYIYDMGFPASVKPYHLSPLQMAYAVAINPFVAVGDWGSLIATGSVTEPFLPETRDRALGYIKALTTYLRNPIQVSTKMPPPQELVALQKGLDVLISVVDVAGKFEPKAPPPIERLKAGAELIRRGGRATLFIRPILPGVTDRELTRLLILARDLGYTDVVFGTLRVTPAIYRRLKAFGVDVSSYLRGLREGRQTPIFFPKIRLVETARELGFTVHPASCASNTTAHGQACALCRWGPCGNVDKLKVDVEDIREYLEARGYKAEVWLDGLKIVIKGKVGERDRVFLEQATRLKLESAR